MKSKTVQHRNVCAVNAKGAQVMHKYNTDMVKVKQITKALKFFIFLINLKHFICELSNILEETFLCNAIFLVLTKRYVSLVLTNHSGFSYYEHDMI